MEASIKNMKIGDLYPEDVNPWDMVLIPSMCWQRITNTGSEDLIFLAICTPRYKAEVYEDIEER